MENVKAILANSRFLVQLAAALYYIWDRVLGPIRRPLVRGLVQLWNWYRELWIKWTYNEYGGFVYVRGGLMLTWTIILLWMIPTLTVLTFQTTMYLFTRHQEDIYLIQSHEVYPDDNIWSVRGCDKLPCDTSSSVYFRIQPTLFNQVWSLATKRTIFMPDDVGSSVPTGLTKCHVHSYGIRVKALMRNWEIYPDAIDISCDGAVKN